MLFWKNITDVSNLIFTNNMGQQIELSQFATITEAQDQVS
jgi:HAE1 family hydrophobic/amphiphilic exporter-1